MKKLLLVSALLLTSPAGFTKDLAETIYNEAKVTLTDQVSPELCPEGSFVATAKRGSEAVLVGCWSRSEKLTEKRVGDTLTQVFEKSDYVDIIWLHKTRVRAGGFKGIPKDLGS